MPIYKTTIAGRTKPVLIKAESAAKAKDEIVTVEALTAEQMADALANGDKVWTKGTPLPEDDKAKTDAGAGEQQIGDVANDKVVVGDIAKGLEPDKK